MIIETRQKNGKKAMIKVKPDEKYPGNVFIGARKYSSMTLNEAREFRAALQAIVGEGA